MMLYVKSILAGLITLFLSAFAFTVIQVFRGIQAAKAEMVRAGAVEVGIDMVVLFKSPRFWIVVLFGFGMGFWWQYRRTS